MPRQRRPDALGQLVGKLVAQKKINREDARRIIETASASRPPMQTRPNTHGQISGELRDILDQARNELAELQEAREEMPDCGSIWSARRRAFVRRQSHIGSENPPTCPEAVRTA